MSATTRARKRALAAQRDRELERARLVAGRGGERCSSGVYLEASEHYLSTGGELAFVSGERDAANLNPHDLCDVMRAERARRSSRGVAT